MLSGRVSCPPNFRAKLERIAELASLGVSIGFPEGKVPPDVIQRSLALEYRWQGRYQPPHWWRRTHEVGQREYVHWAFLRKARLALQKEVPSLLREAIHEGRSGREAWERVGRRGVELAIQEIDRVWYPQLAARTIEAKRRKGRPYPEKPLVETGEMRASVTFEVRPRERFSASESKA